MKKHRKEELVAGVVVIGGLVLLGALLALVTGRISWADTQQVQVVFDDVRGLKKGDPVFFHGVPCGRVGAVRHKKGDWQALWPDEPPERHVKVVLDLDIDETTGAYLKTRSKVTVEKTITGITAVIVREGKGEPLTSDTVIRGDSGTAIEDLAAEAKTVGRSLNDLISEIRGAVGELRQENRLGDTVASLHATAANFEELTGTVRSFIEESRGSWKKSVTNVEELTTRMNETVEAIQPSLTTLIKETGPQIRSILEDVKAVTAELKPHAAELGEALAALPNAINNVRDVTTEVRTLLTRNRHRVDGTVRDLSAAAQNVAAATGEIRRQPWRLLYRPDAEECSTLGILDSVREYNIATSRLEQAVEELHVLHNGPPEVQALTTEALKEAQAALKRYRETEAALWAELKH